MRKKLKLCGILFSRIIPTFFFVSRVLSLPLIQTYVKVHLKKKSVAFVVLGCFEE